MISSWGHTLADKRGEGWMLRSLSGANALSWSQGDRCLGLFGLEKGHFMWLLHLYEGRKDRVDKFSELRAVGPKPE